jgi:hypothetical protein
VRALLDVIRRNEASVESMAAAIQHALQLASKCLTALDPEAGEEDLITAVAAELAKLRELLRSF